MVHLVFVARIISIVSFWRRYACEEDTERERGVEMNDLGTDIRSINDFRFL